MIDMESFKWKRSGIPGHGEYPQPYKVVDVITRSRGRDKSINGGQAYWSGYKWIGVNGFKIGYSNVTRWIER